MTREQLLERLKHQMPHLRQVYGIRRLGVFGSYARAEQTPDSDLDLIYELNDDVVMGLFQVMTLEEYLKERVPVERIDLVNARWINPLVAREMRNDVIYVS